MTSQLPVEKSRVKALVLSKVQYEAIDNVLYHLEPLTIVLYLQLATKACLMLLIEGCLDSTYAQLRYTVDFLDTIGGRFDIEKCTKSCQVCASTHVC